MLQHMLDKTEKKKAEILRMAGTTEMKLLHIMCKACGLSRHNQHMFVSSMDTQKFT